MEGPQNHIKQRENEDPMRCNLKITTCFLSGSFGQFWPYSSTQTRFVYPAPVPVFVILTLNMQLWHCGVFLLYLSTENRLSKIASGFPSPSMFTNVGTCISTDNCLDKSEGPHSSMPIAHPTRGNPLLRIIRSAQSNHI